jgi:O-antigen ligase
MPAGPRVVAALLVAGLFACAVVVMPYAALGAERFALPKELVVHATAALAAIGCLAGGISLVDRRLVPLLLGMLAWAALSFAITGAPAWEAARSGGLLASLVVLLACTRTIAAVCPRLLAWGIAAVVVVVAGTALLEAHGVLARTPLPPSGTIGNRNALAHLLAISVPFLVACALSARSRVEVAGFAIAIALAASVVVLTRCRAAWLALAVVAAIAIVATALARTRLSRLPRLPTLACAAALALGVTAAVVVPNRLAWATGSPYRDTVTRLVELDRGSGRGRLVQYEATLAMAADHVWLGVGSGNWSVVYPRYAPAQDPSYQPAHLFPVNRLPSGEWLGMLAMLGLPALALLAGFAIRYAALAARRRAIAALATLAGIGALGALDAVLGRAAPAMFAVVVLGALLPRRPSDERGAGDAARGAGIAWRTRRVWIPALLAAASAVFAVQSARLVAAAYAFGDGRARIQREAAARIAPGGLYFTTYLATDLLRHRECERGRALAGRVLADYPHLVTLRELAQACEQTTTHQERPNATHDEGTDHRLRRRAALGRLPRRSTRRDRPANERARPVRGRARAGKPGTGTGSGGGVQQR